MTPITDKLDEIKRVCDALGLKKQSTLPEQQARKVIRSVGCTEIKKNDDGTFSFIGTNESTDRLGDVIETEGWLLDNWKANPIILWAHDSRQPPLGTGNVKINQEEKRLVFDVKFAPEGIYPFADTIRKLVAADVIRAVSVGFIPYEWEERSDDEVPDHLKSSWFPPLRFKKQELLELSIVNVPANPDALSITDEEKGMLKSRKNDSLRVYRSMYGIADQDSSGTEHFTLLTHTIERLAATVSQMQQEIKNQINSTKELSTVVKELAHLAELAAEVDLSASGDKPEGVKTVNLQSRLLAEMDSLKKAFGG